MKDSYRRKKKNSLPRALLPKVRFREKTQWVHPSIHPSPHLSTYFRQHDWYPPPPSLRRSTVQSKLAQLVVRFLLPHSGLDRKHKRAALFRAILLYLKTHCTLTSTPTNLMQLRVDRAEKLLGRHRACRSALLPLQSDVLYLERHLWKRTSHAPLMPESRAQVKKKRTEGFEGGSWYSQQR